PVEGLRDALLAEFAALCAPSKPYLVITSRRALALGINTRTPMAVQLSAFSSSESIVAFVSGSTSDLALKATPASQAAAAGIELVKLSHGLPAVLAGDLGQHVLSSEHGLITVDADATRNFFDSSIQSLTLASEAVVPLNSGSSARFIVFRDA